jgi:PEGA domain
MHGSVLGAVAWLLLGCFASVPVLRADAPVDEVVKLVDEGLKLRTEGRDAEALGRFEAAYAKRKEPRALAQIALAEQALGRWGPAHAHLAEALTHRDDAWINQRRAHLDGALRRIESEFSSIEIVSNVPGSAISMNGHEVGITPLAQPIRLLPGSFALRVRAVGHLPFEQRIEVARGQQVRVVADLTAEPAPPPKLAAAPNSQAPAEPVYSVPESAVPEPVIARPVITPASAPAAPENTGELLAWRRPSVLLGAAGAGVASMLVAGATYAVAGKKAKSLKADCYEVACAADEREDRRSTVKTLDRTSRVFFGLGLTAVLGSGITYLVARDLEVDAKKKPSMAAPVTVSAAFDRSGASLLGTIAF